MSLVSEEEFIQFEEIFRVYIHDIREISLYVQRRIRVDVGLVFGVKINPC